uniref:Uncharacterized protein n=1 Tax=Arundo donax TaxID=35708 RepID=A0A0A8ZKI0_ARUDO
MRCSCLRGMVLGFTFQVSMLSSRYLYICQN